MGVARPTQVINDALYRALALEAALLWACGVADAAGAAGEPGKVRRRDALR